MKPDLSQLRDIHLPQPVSWWPPAPGWWLVAALVLLTIALGLYVYRRRQASRWRRAALGEWRRLQEDWVAGSVDTAQVARELSALLRRVALARFPRAEVAALTGERWLAFLDSALPGEPVFSSGAGRVLLEAPYAAQVEVDVAALFDACGQWLRHLPRRAGQ